MSTPVDEQTPPAAPEQQTGTHPAVRTCERCGTVCASDQEWCLSCGVRLTDEGQRLPGIRAAATAVVLAVLLAGGAAAAAYAALRGDARDSAATGSAPSASPIAQAAPTVTDPVPGGSDATPTLPTTPKTTSTPKATPSVSTPPAATPTPAAPAATPSPSPAPSTSGSSNSSGSSSSSGSDSSGSDSSSNSSSSSSTNTGVQTGTVGGKSGPITLAGGAGSVYDLDNVLADDGGTEGQAKAIDSSSSTAWKYKLTTGATGGFGYIVDLGGKSSLKSIRITTPTSGLQAEILGTTGTNPPKDRLDSRWKTLSSARAVTSKKSVALKDVSGGTAAYRYVLVYFKASPASGQINDIQIRR